MKLWTHSFGNWKWSACYQEALGWINENDYAGDVITITSVVDKTKRKEFHVLVVWLRETG
jgi:hypothetical protein